MIWLAWLSTALASDFSFVVLADTQGEGEAASINWETLPQLVEDINVHAPDVLVVAGGLVAGSDSLETQLSQWDDFQTVMSSFPGELMLLPGTSDLVAGEGSFDAWRTAFDFLPTDDSPVGEEGISYYRDHGLIRMVAIASDGEMGDRYSVSEEGMLWLDHVLGEAVDAEHIFVMTHHPVSFSDHVPSETEWEEPGLGHTGDAFWQLMVRHEVRALFAGHWNRYQPAQLGHGGDTWEYIVGTGGGNQQFEALRPYQERVGFLLVDVDGPTVTTTFFGDDDEDGRYDNPIHTVAMVPSETASSGLRARYDFDDGTISDSAPVSTRYGVNGQLVGQAELMDDGVSGLGLQVVGDGDFAMVSGLDAYKLGILEDLTLSMWVRIPALNSGEHDNVLIAYANQDLFNEDEESNFAYRLNVLSDGRLQMLWEYENGTNVRVVSSAPATLDDNEWHHLGVVRDSTRKRLDFYVDGMPLGLSSSYVRNPTGSSRGLLYLGADIAEKRDDGTGAGEWLWSDGSELTYTAWASGEPNDWGGDQDCGVMNWGGSVEEDWDDLGCDEVRPFICQGAELIDTTTDTGDTGEVVPEEDLDCTQVDYEGEVTLFCTSVLNWSDARDACLARGLDLVSIQTAEEQAWLVEQGDLIGSYNWFMGLRERESVSAVDEVCIYDQVLDAAQMARLGDLEDCVTVLEPLPDPPPDPPPEEDTDVSSDSGLGGSVSVDTGSPSDVEDEVPAETEEEGEAEIDEPHGESEATGSTDKRSGCAHAPMEPLGAVWLWCVAVLLGRREKGWQ